MPRERSRRWGAWRVPWDQWNQTGDRIEATCPSACPTPPVVECRGGQKEIPPTTTTAKKKYMHCNRQRRRWILRRRASKGAGTAQEG
eukprot:scaffold28579_cov50-Attheya_sp.AAC.3